MLIKRKVLKSIYGDDYALPELKPLQKFNANEERPLKNTAPDPALNVDELAEERIKERVEELYARKEAEVAEIERQAQVDIQKAINDSKILAQQILDDAQLQATTLREQILAQAELEKKNIENLASAEKLRAFNEGMTKADAYISDLMRILSSFNSAKQEILLDVKEEIAGLAIHVAKQILEREVFVNPQFLEEQILKAVNLVAGPRGGVIQVFLNPIDQEKSAYLEANLAKLLDESIKLIFLKDENIDPGSCVINTAGGRLDLSFSSQIELIKVAFEKYLGHKIEEIPEPGLDQIEAETIMPRDQSEIIESKLGHISEPSDEELELIEAEADEFAEIMLDEDLDTLLSEVLSNDGADVKDDSSVKIDDDLPLSEIEEENYNNDKEEITLRYEENDELKLDDEKDDLADDDESFDLDDEDYEDLAEVDDDENFDDSDEGDGRFPEY